MKKLFVVVALSSLVAFAGSASADDLAGEAVHDWAGPYIGLQAGYGWGHSDITYFLDGGGSFPTSGASFGTEGFIGGVHAGWNWQSDALVIGAEADVNFASIDGAFTLLGGNDYTTDVQATGSLRARFGFAMNRTLVYATGGLAIADVELGTFDASRVVREEDNKTYYGYTVGGGLEHMFTDALSARIEYRFTDLGKENFDWVLASITANGDYDVTFHTIQAGLSWHF